MPQLNSQMTVAGYSPTQWVLGYQPQVPGILLSKEITPQHLTRGTSFEVSLHKRNGHHGSRRGRKIRRALLRRYAGQNQPLAVGQLCHYWRDAGQADLIKIRWKGPAMVVMRELNDRQQPTTYWIVHKTQLICCAPHHVRPDESSARQYHEVLRNLKSRGVTRFMDLNRLNKRNIDDIDSDEQEDDGDSDVEEMAKRRRIGAGPPAGDSDYDMSEPDDIPHQAHQPPAGAPSSGTRVWQWAFRLSGRGGGGSGHSVVERGPAASARK